MVVIACSYLLAASSSIIVSTTAGPVLGQAEMTTQGGIVNAFRGVPFAASTAGPNRWKPPQLPKPWTSPYNATVNGLGCYQPHHNADVPCGGDKKCQSEDCLNLNVYCPEGASGLPVFFWIYGGAFDEGMNWGPVNLYYGLEIAHRGGVCVVAPNYRLGVLGYLVTDEHKGNQGIQDQRAAMQWTQQNIANFGGDPSKVTIVGQSAGAMSVSIHLVSPASAGLFRAAIMMSNVAAFRYQDASAQKVTFGTKFASLAGCGSVANISCLRGLSADQAVTLGEKASSAVGEAIIDRILAGGYVEDAFAMQWAPVVDEDELPAQPLKLFATQAFHKVPVLLGTAQDEGATFIYAGVKFPLPESLYPLLMDAIFLEDATKVIAYYANVSSAWKDARDSLSYVLTDFWFKCSSSSIALAVRKAGMDAWVYRFDHVYSDGLKSIFEQFGLPAVCATRVCHASDVPFVFHNFANFTPSADEVDLSDQMLAYWTNFVKHGNVNGDASAQGARGPSLMPWPVFDESTRLDMRLHIPTEVESTLTGQPGALPTLGVCRFFDSQVGYDH
jgi:carboxylesterase type B